MHAEEALAEFRKRKPNAISHIRRGGDRGQDPSPHMQSNASTVSPTLLDSPVGSTISDPFIPNTFSAEGQGIETTVAEAFLSWCPQVPSSWRTPSPSKSEGTGSNENHSDDGSGLVFRATGEHARQHLLIPQTLIPFIPPLMPMLATPPSSDLQSSPVTLTRTPTPTLPESSSPQTLTPSLSPLPTPCCEALIHCPQLRPSTIWDYYIRTQGMRIPCPLYHKVKIKKSRKMVKKPKKYHLTPEEFREQEMRALVEMPTSGYMLTRQVLGKLLDSQRPRKATN